MAMQSALKHCKTRQHETSPRRHLHNGYVAYRCNGSYVVFKGGIEYASFYSLWSANQFSIEKGELL